MPPPSPNRGLFPRFPIRYLLKGEGVPQNTLSQGKLPYSLPHVLLRISLVFQL